METELHRDRNDPNDNKKRSVSGSGANAMSVEEFMDGLVRGWEGHQDVVAPGQAGKILGTWQEAIGKRHTEMTK